MHGSSTTEPLPAAPPRAQPAGDDALAQRVREHARWDAVAQGIPDLYEAASTQAYRRCEIALLRRTVGPLRGKRVLKLDLWNEAVNTRILNWMAGQGAEAWGLDASRVTTGRAGENAAGRLRLLRADIRELPFADASFDVVYTMGTIEHVREYAEAVREVARVLRPGGTAIVGVPRRWDPFLRPLVVRALEQLGRYAYSPERTFSAAELGRVLEDAGLTVTERTGLLAFPGVLRMADLLCFTRGIPLHRLSPLWLRPFEALETRTRLGPHLGYLLVLVGRRP